jgi:hypothetical protein
VTDQEITSARAAVAKVTAAYADAIAAITDVGDRQERFELATDLGETINDLRTRTGQFRAEIAHEIYRAESLSLAGLANRIGVSRGRAQDLVEAARAAEQQEEKPDE